MTTAHDALLWRDSLARLTQRATARRSEDRRNMLLVAAIAIALRILFLASYQAVLTNDSAGYLSLARRIGSANLTGYNGTRTPGYPVLLFLFGYSPTTAWVAQSLLGTASALLVYRIVRQLEGGSTSALIAALLYATSLEVLSIERMVMTESLTAFLLTSATLLSVKLFKASGTTLRTPTLLGLTLSFLCLVRPDLLLVSLYLIAAVIGGRALAMRREGRRDSLRTLSRLAVTVFAPLAVALVGWLAVNVATIGSPTLSTVLGFNMIDHVAPEVTIQQGHNYALTAIYVTLRKRQEQRTGDWGNTSYTGVGEMERVTQTNVAGLSRRLLGIAVGVIEDHPLFYFKSSLKQWPRFWLQSNYATDLPGTSQSEVIRIIWPVERALALTTAALFLVATAIEIVRRSGKRNGVLSGERAMVAGAILVGTIPPVFFAYGDTGRYGAPYFPLILAVTFAIGGGLLRFRAQTVQRCSGE